MAIIGHPPGETPATTPPSRQVPRHAQGARQTKQCQGNRRTPSRPNGARANAGRSQGSPPGQAPATTPLGRQVPRHARDTLQTKRRQGKRKALARPSSAKARAGHSPGQATPRQAPAKQTHQDKQRQTKRRQIYKPKSPAPRETGDFSCRDPELLVAVL